MPNPLWKRFMQGGGRPPLYTNLSFYSKKRTGSTIVNEINGGGDGELVGGNYAYFNGIDNHCIISNNVLNADSISFEFNIGSSTERMAVFGGILDDSCIYFYGGQLGTGKDASSSLATSTSFNDNKWHSATVTKTIEGSYEIIVDESIQDLAFNGAWRTSSMATIGCNVNPSAGTSLYFDGCLRNVEIDNSTCYKFNNILGSTIYDISINKNHIIANGDLINFWQKDYTEVPYNADNGMSIISGVDGEVPAELGTQFNALNGDPLTNPATSKIVSNVDGYILMPSDIEIETGKPLFNRDDTDIYNSDARSTILYLGDEMGGEEAYYWHISELNTATILSYMNNDYKNSWFVKNTFETGTYDVVTVKEILAYNAPITDVDDLSKLMKYLKLNVWYDSQTWDDNLDWID